MKYHLKKSRRGFTLIELMVAMAITTIMVTILISITSMSLDTWNRSRSEIRASRQAQAMTEIMARDFEAMVMRGGNEFEWLVAEAVDDPVSVGAAESPNSANLIFFTAATDRYNGNVGGIGDLGGDISTVGYSLRAEDPIGTSSGDSDFKTFVLYRKLVNPDESFRDLLGREDLKTAFSSYQADLDDMENFVCENIYQFSVTFHLDTDVVIPGEPPMIERRTAPFTMAPGASTSMRVSGNGMEAIPDNASIGESSRITAIEISITVLSDSAMNAIRSRPTIPDDFIAQNSYQYTKRIEVPRM